MSYLGLSALTFTLPASVTLFTACPPPTFAFPYSVTHNVQYLATGGSRWRSHLGPSVTDFTKRCEEIQQQCDDVNM